MAITATLTLDNSSATSGEAVGGTVTVSNSGASAVNILRVTGDVPAPNGATTGRVAFKFNHSPRPTAVPASGTNVSPFKVVVYSPQGPGSAAQSYTLAINVYTDDGSLTAATGATGLFIYPPQGTTVPTAGSMNGSIGVGQQLLYPLLLV